MMLKHGALVCAMDGSKMVLLRNQGDTQKPVLQPIMQEAADNPRSSDLGTDRPGRSFSSASPRRSAMTETDLHSEAKSHFARHAIAILETHHNENKGDLVVLAAPSVLGNFRKLCPASLKSAIVAEIDKDVVNHPPEDIASIISAAQE